MDSNLSSRPRLVGVGGAHVDRRGRVTGIYVPHASNPGLIREDVGGVVFNAIRNAKQRGVAATLISMRGGDASGDRIARAIAEAGIEDHSAVYLDRTSASYTAFIDRDGELIAGLADMDLYAGFTRHLRRSACRHALASADAVLCDANLHEDALSQVVNHSGNKPVFAIGISPAKVVRLAGLLDRINCVFMNRSEAAALAGVTGDVEIEVILTSLRERGLRRAVITAGSKPLTAFESNKLWMVEPAAPRAVVDVTGAGDALAGATVAALLGDRAFPAAVREGMAAAMLSVESPHAVPVTDEAAFAQALSLVPAAVSVA